MKHNVEIRCFNTVSADARMLLRAGHDAMQALFSGTRKTPFSVDALNDTGVKILLAYHEETPAGCCAVFDHAGYSELKKLYVVPDKRGFGIAEHLLLGAEGVAHRNHSQKIMLESGVRLQAAHRLYLRLGYVERGVFGAHHDLSDSLFFEKTLKP